VLQAQIQCRLRSLPIPREAILHFLLSAMSRLGLEDAEVTVRVTTDRALARANRRWRGRKGSTDVLSFPGPRGGAYLGDIMVSGPAAARQGKELGHGTAVECARLILHGLLHLAGYDHESDDGEMAALEEEMWRALMEDE